MAATVLESFILLPFLEFAFLQSFAAEENST
jgi:hypothetical protein